VAVCLFSSIYDRLFRYVNGGFVGTGYKKREAALSQAEVAFLGLLGSLCNRIGWKSRRGKGGKRATGEVIIGCGRYRPIANILIPTRHFSRHRQRDRTQWIRSNLQFYFMLASIQNETFCPLSPK